MALLVSLLTLLATCALAAAAPPCALAPPCPPPAWPAQYNLTLSTLIEPGGPMQSGGYFVPSPSTPFGLISLDWSVASSIWMRPNQNESHIEATAIENCRRIKAASPGTRCFIYHNTELALQAMESQRAVMYDPSKAHWFLQYTDGMGTKNGTIYNAPGVPGDQYFFDFRVEEALQFYVSSVLNTTTWTDGQCSDGGGVGSGNCVDGSFSDDVIGIPAGHPNCTSDMNLTSAEVAAIQAATASASQALISAAISRGKYVWQAFGAQAGVGPGVTRDNCTSFMRSRCNLTFAAQPISMQHDASNSLQSIAAFCVLRGPIAYLGYGWESDEAQWDPSFSLQVGQPVGTCEEVTAGVFSRAWSYGNVSIDCNSWAAVVPHTTGVSRSELARGD